MYRPNIDRKIYLNQYYAKVLSKLQRGIQKMVVKRKETLLPSGIEPRMFSLGVVRVR